MRNFNNNDRVDPSCLVAKFSELHRYSIFGLFILNLTFPLPLLAQAENGDIRGVIEAKQQASIRTNIDAVVQRTPFRTGERFKKGQTLIAFDCSAQQAEQEAAAAVLAAALSRHDNNKEMLEYGAMGQFDVRLSQSELDEADARLRAIRANLKQCTIKAPYNGRVTDLIVNAHEKPNGEDPLIKIVGDGALELKLIVPSNWLGWLKSDTEFTFTVDETGETLPARVTRIGAAVDAVSRTITIIGEFSERALKVLPGMSGTAKFPLETAAL